MDAAEAEDEVAVAVVFEGKPHVHELNVVVPLLPGIVDGCPDGEYAGVLSGVAFTQSGGEPQVGGPVGEDGNGAADDALLIPYYIDAPDFLVRVCLDQFQEEVHAGEMLAYLGGVVFLQHPEEGTYLVGCPGDVDGCTVVQSAPDLPAA